jgi:Spy/CpxP family protein refolding chaperone
MSATAHEHWEDLRDMSRTFSAETYERMLENHALTDEQRQQLLKMRDRRSRMEAETQCARARVAARATAESALMFCPVSAGC